MNGKQHRWCVRLQEIKSETELTASAPEKKGGKKAKKNTKD